jgi:phage terminase large subunit GpA-like protein
MSSLIEDFAATISKGLIDCSLETCSRWCENRLEMPAPHKGPFTFEHFPWQKEILNTGNTPRVSVQKGAQLGFSVAAIAKCLHVIDSKKEDVLYILPTDKIASVFAQSRLDTLVSLSP